MFALAPGSVLTRLFIEAGVKEPLNTVTLPAATTLYFTSGRVDRLAFRKVHGPVIADAFITHAAAPPGTTLQIGQGY